ncbi:MAG: NADAR domain-containing protein [Atopobiaceae bacterium]|jgi:ribA/ribD-fused uncharacterized protein
MHSPVITEYQGKKFALFYNPHEDNGCLSNWFEAPLTLDGQQFATAEQAFIYLKARHFGDIPTAMRVPASTDARYLKRLNKQITPFNSAAWHEVRVKIMHQCLKEKFTQNPDLASFLLATGDALIAQCSPHDRFWSNGCDATRLSRLDPDQWLGKNQLGELLMELRSHLLGEKNQAAEVDAPQEGAPEAAAPEGVLELDTSSKDALAPAAESAPSKVAGSAEASEAAEPLVAVEAPEVAEPEEAPVPAPTEPAAPQPKALDMEAYEASGECAPLGAAELKGLVQAFLGSLSAADLDALIKGMSGSSVVVPAVVADSWEEAQEDPEAQFYVEIDGRQIRPAMAENNAGQRWFAVFTSADEVLPEQLDGRELLVLPMAACVEIARTRGDAQGIIVNAYSDCLTLTPETCLKIADYWQKSLRKKADVE